MNIRTLMRIVGPDRSETEAQAAAAAAEDYIRAYCGLCQIPPQLEGIALTMAAALVRASDSAGVRSVEVGDTRVDLGNVSADAVLAVCGGYDKLLDRFRRIRW